MEAISEFEGSRKILIFASATDARMNEILEEAKEIYKSIYLVVQKKRAIIYQNRYPKLNIIETNTDFIDYKLVKKENKIPPIKYDSIWIPSSYQNNLSSFGEVLSIAISIKSKEIIWKGANANDITINNSLKDKIKNICYSHIAWKFYMYGKMKTIFLDKMKGYQW